MPLSSFMTRILTNQMVIFCILYFASIIWLVVKLRRYKRPTKILGSFDYGYFYEQTLHTRAAIAVAINTSFVALASNPNSPATLTLLSGLMCLFVVWILVGRFK